MILEEISDAESRNYWHAAYVIPKGAGEEIRQKGPSSFVEDILQLSPVFEATDSTNYAIWTRSAS